MSQWIQFLFGLDHGEIPAGAEAHFELTGLWRGFAGWLALIIITGSVALIIALYRRENQLTRTQRASLGALRLLALALVVWMLLDPRILTELHLKRDAYTYVLLDTSGSMGSADAFDAKERRALSALTGPDIHHPASRASLVLAAAAQNDLVGRLEEKNRVRLFTFDASLKALEKLDGHAFKPPGGPDTRLGDALLGVLKQAGADPLAGIVVLTDGRSNAGEPIDRAASEAALRGVPVYPVCIGKTREPRNYAVTQLSGPDMAVPGFPLRIEGRVEVSGMEGPVQVTLYRQLAKGGARVPVETRTVEGKGVKTSASLVFTDTIEKNGTYKYTLAIPRKSQESDPSDNQRSVQVTAADEKCRILLAAGGPTPEFKFLRNFLIRDDGLQVSCWLSSAEPGYPQDGDVVIRDLPQTADKLRAYDAVLLLDPDPRSLSDGFLAALKDFVLEQGGGVAYVAGEYFFDDLFSLDRLEALRAVLPVELGSEPRSRVPRSHSRPWRPQLTRQGAEHPLCRLADTPEENEQVWAQLPGFHYSASVRTLKPAATALLEREGGEIVAATQKAGAGYTVFLSTDDFNRWRSWRAGVHERFWGAVVRYTALGKKVSGTGEASLYADRDRYSPGEEVSFEASVSDPERKPIVKDRIEVAIERAELGAGAEDLHPRPSESEKPGAASEARVRINLLAIPGRPGWYSGRFRPEASGRFLAAITGEPSAPGGENSAGKAAFSVVGATSEWDDPSPDPEALEDLAKRTGGVYFPLEEINQVPERIGDRSVTEVVGRSASTVWDSSVVMLLFGAILILEWILRKVWRLN